MRKVKGITLISLVITIIILIILASISINLTIGENGIFTKAKEAKKAQIVAEAKEKIGTEILTAQVEAIERDEELEQSQVEDIISKYGELQEDKDTIILKDNNYEISLLDIYQGTITTSGSYTENKAKIELLEGQVNRLQEQLDSMSQTGDEKDKTIAKLNEKVTTIENEKNVLQNENNSLTSKATELTNLKDVLEKTTATEDKILKDYKAYSNGKLITGIMENKGELNWNPNEGETLNIDAGYYSGGTISTENAYQAGYNDGVSESNIKNVKFSFSWSGSTTEGITITKTATIPIDSKILCYSSESLSFKYKVQKNDGDNLKGGWYNYTISFNNTTGVVTVTMIFNPYTSYITVTNITTSGTLHYY